MFKFKVKIAEVVIGFKSSESQLRYNPLLHKGSDGFSGFLYDGAKKPDFSIIIKYGIPAWFKRENTIFDVIDNWRLYKQDGKILLEYPKWRAKRIINRLVELDNDFREATIYVNKKSVYKLQKDVRKISRGIIATTRGDFLQVFLAWYLSNNRKGVLGHSVFIEDDGKGFLFMGPSTAGKSTMAEIWSANGSAVRVYNDDRAVLKFENKKVYFYNVPWRGEYYMGYPMPNSDDKVEINKIFFIYHAKRNIARQLGKAEATSKIFRNIFPPFWDKKGLGCVIELCGRIASTVPCYDLGFVNNERVVEFVRRIMYNYL